MGFFLLRPGVKKIGFIGFLAIFLLASLSCQKEAKKPTKIEKITIAGSDTGIPLIEHLAQAYNRKQDKIKIQIIPGLHSRGGIKGVKEGLLDLGVITQDLPELKGAGLKKHHLARVAIVIAAHPDLSDVSDISSEQVREVYTGEITNWRQLGGEDAEIVVLDRPEGKSAKVYLRKAVLGEDLKVTAKVATFDFEQDLADALKVTAQAIGYLSLAEAKRLNLRILSLDGVKPTLENVRKGDYKVIRYISLVTKGEPKGAAKDFIEFALGSEGRKVILKNNYLPQ